MNIGWNSTWTLVPYCYAPGAGAGLYGLVLAALEPPKPEVRFSVTKVGETEVLTSDGFRVTVRVKVKSLKRAGSDKGVALYDLDFEIVPTVAPLLSIHQLEGEKAN